MSELVKTALEKIESSQIIPGVSKTRQCSECHKPIELSDGSSSWHDDEFTCYDCQRTVHYAWRKQQEAEAKAEHSRRLDDVPTCFRSTQRSRLPHPEKLDAALEWKFGPLGLLLYGPTGCGKSRIAWEVAKREIEAGTKFKSVNAFELSRYPSLFMTDGNAAAKFADELAEVRLLMLDDVFKAKPTERVEELLFAVVDQRGQWERPCIVTLNDTGDSLAGRLSPDRGPALIRRLREYCHTIKF